MTVTEEQAQLHQQLFLLREAADAGDVSHKNLNQWLCDALQDCKPPGCWCYVCDFVGDGESGKVVFYMDGDLTQAPYTITQSDGKISVVIDMEACEDVLEVTTYKVEGEEDEEEDEYEPDAAVMASYGSMEAAGLYTKGPVPLCERNIPQKKRDKMPAKDFAGKGTSFPISTQADLDAAVKSMGRAGSDNFPPEKIKANIKRIAKRKGLKLPDAWEKECNTESAREADKKAAAQAMHDKAVKAKSKDSHAAAVKLGADCGDDCPMAAKDEAHRHQEAGARNSSADLKRIQTIHDAAQELGADCTKSANDNNVGEAADIEISGDAIELREGAVGQDGTVLLKVIQPGWGSSGYYPEEVLERDLPKIYPAGTKNFWDHATPTQEAERPEGSLRDLASVTTEPVKYLKDGPKGPGGYVKAKAAEAFRQPIDDLAKYIGMSIRATGKAKEGKAPDGRRGKIIEQLTSGISIDYVTTPGAGGQVLQLFEAARGSNRGPNPQPQQEPSMAAENQQLTEALQTDLKSAQAEIRKLKERAAVGDAAGEVAAYFKTVRATEAVQKRVTDRVLAGAIPMTEAGELDRKKLREFAEAQLNDELEFLKSVNPSIVRDMGSQPPTRMSEAEREKLDSRRKKELKESTKRFASLMGFGGSLGKNGRKILAEGRSAFDLNYNARHKGAQLSGVGGVLVED